MKLENFLILLVFLVLLCSCSKIEPTHEVRPDTYPNPLLTVENQDEIISNGIEAMVEGQVTFKFTAQSEAGLVRLVLNGETVRTFTYGQLYEEFNYNFLLPDVPEVILNFAIIDEQDKIASLPPITVKAKGRLPDVVLIADMQGEFIEQQNVPLPAHSAASKFQDVIAVESDIEGLTHAYPRYLWSNQTGSTGIFAYHQADPAGGSEHSMKITKPLTAFNMQIRFGTTIPEVLISDLASGKRELQMDIYIENGTMPSSDNSFVVFFANFNLYRNDTSGMYDLVNVWTFSNDNLNKWSSASFERTPTGNTGGAKITADQVDMLVIKPTMNQDHGPYYIKNIRIVKK